MPYLVLGAAQLAVGAAAIFARYALGGAGALAVAAARLSIAAALLLAFGALRRNTPAPDPRQRAVLACAGVALALHFGTWIASLDYTSVAVSTLVVATTPVYVALYDALALGVRLSLRAWLAFAGGGAGLALVVGFNRTPPPVPGHQWLGIALAFVGAVAIGAYFVLVREVREALGTRTIVTHTYGWGAAALILAAAAARQAPPPLHDGAAWGGIVAMALISQMLGHTALNASLRWFSPTAVSFSTLLEPVSAAALAFAIFGERIAPAAMLGGAIVLAAIGVFLYEEKRMNPPAGLDRSRGKELAW